MAISVVMPALEMAQETGKLLAWRKKEGELVKKGEPLLEIETDKAVVEVESPGDGTLAGVTAKVGDEVAVGKTIGWLVAPGETPPVVAESAAPSARGSSATVAAAPVAAAASVSVTSGAPQISPKARRLAKELGVDFTLVRGTGPDGVITAEDVQGFAAGKGATATATEAGLGSASEALSPIARLMAERTTQSWTTIPHFFVTREVDCTELLKAHQQHVATIAKSGGGKLSLTDVLIALVGRTLAKHPRLHATWVDGAVKLNTEVHVSVAMAVTDGVVGAVVRDADKQGLAAICARRSELTELARANKLKPADISGGMFTISNLGMYKVDAFTAIIPPGQAAILAVGVIAEKVVAVDGKPAVRPVMSLTLSSDHRLIDGARAAEYLAELVGAMGEPEKWLRE